MIAYWRKYIKNFAKKSAPVYDALAIPRWKSGLPEPARAALVVLRTELLKEDGAFLWHPRFGKDAGEWRIRTDASSKGLGAQLLQKLDGEWRPVYFASKRLSPTETRYDTHKLEAFAIVWAVKLFKNFVWNKRFVVQTDNAACTHLKEAEKGMLAKWALQLSEYDFRIDWIKGSRNGVSDCLSRNPLPTNDQQEEKGSPATVAMTRLVSEEDELSTARVARAQRRDGEWTAPIIAAIENGERNERFEINDSVLCDTRPRPGKQRKELVKRAHRVAIPLSLVSQVLKLNHSIPIAGHRGFQKTFRAIAGSYTWPGMKRDTRNMISGCLPCKRRKTPVQRNGELQPMLMASKPAQFWAIDLQTGLPTDKDGNTVLLTCVDMFSRFALAIPLPNRTTARVAEAFYRNVVLQHGVPETIICDNEGAFKARDAQTLFRKLGIECKVGAAYAPWHQGHVERFHSFLNQTLTIFCNKYASDWRQYLDEILLAYRVSSHDAMDGLSPFEVHYGRPCRLPSGIMRDLNANSYENSPETPTQCVERTADALGRAHTWVREAQERNALRNKQRHDAKHTPVAFQEGEQVLVFRPEVRLTRQEREERARPPKQAATRPTTARLSERGSCRPRPRATPCR
jgi:transposase InsO family protein